MQYAFDRVEQIVEKRKNANYLKFSPFPTIFSTSFTWGQCRKGFNDPFLLQVSNPWWHFIE